MKNKKDLDDFSILTKYFLDNFPLKLLLGTETPKNKKEKIIHEISTRVLDIYTIFFRLNKYPFYFERLYIINDIDISEAETLEYHIQNYLNDFYSLQVKIERLVNFIKNNLREFNISNIKDVEKLIEHIKTNTKNGLSNVVNIRGSHVHNISARDLKISEAKLYLTIVQQADNNKILHLDKNKAKQNYLSSIKEVKEKYIKQSNKNSNELKRFSKFFVSKVGFLVASLYGHNLESFNKIMKDLD
ncbi:MAG: hypothetical protein WAV23_02360 [Minisyncoccia bacterium]